MNTVRTKKGIVRGALCALLVALVLSFAAPSTSAHFESATVEPLLNPDGTLNLNNGLSGAQQVSPPSSTSLASEPPGISANSPLLTGDTWSALPNNGLNGTVDALAVNGSDLYVGGYFTQTADGAVTNLNNIAKFSGGAWSAMRRLRISFET